MGYSPPGHKESDTTERLHSHFSRASEGENSGGKLSFQARRPRRKALSVRRTLQRKARFIKVQ